MARPYKSGLDYFPIDVYFDEDIELLEAEQGLVGFAILIKLWQKIYSNGYYMESKEDNILLFSKKINTDINLVKSVINTCLRRNIFNSNIYEKYKILTSCGIQKRFITACSQSKRKSISLITELILVNSDFIELITEQTTLNHEFSTQSKEEKIESKEKKIDSIFSFSEFWNLYPKKVGKAKCQKIYYKLTFDEIKKIKETIYLYVNWKQFDKWDHPNPETYINQKRWDDELKITPKKSDDKIQTDPNNIGYGKTWVEMSFDEKKKNKSIATSEQLIKFNNEEDNDFI